MRALQGGQVMSTPRPRRFGQVVLRSLLLMLVLHAGLYWYGAAIGVEYQPLSVAATFGVGVGLLAALWSGSVAPRAER